MPFHGCRCYTAPSAEIAASGRKPRTSAYSCLLYTSVLLGGAGGEVEAHLGAAHHQAVAHVVAGVAEVNEVDALEVAEVLPDGEEVGEDYLPTSEGWLSAWCRYPSAGVIQVRYDLRSDRGYHSCSRELSCDCSHYTCCLLYTS